MSLFVPFTIFLGSKENSVSIKISGEKGTLAIISAYSFPAKNITPILQEIKETPMNISNEQALAGADLNAHKRRWGYATVDNRGIYLIESSPLTQYTRRRANLLSS
ncbi:hypothetical protein AVEN_121662-1 [Araneus ventricosus]|uniref:Endonuclease/exonuclease/phosphatase domain-containing protein n=1 Tax=Araneus ventricosus TaxID=182803 RepID=A0A4Y2NVJ2_ARAVE|nr:hypothetical protein AVEN_121662-1 [Araneus ventricosus]